MLYKNVVVVFLCTIVFLPKYRDCVYTLLITIFVYVAEHVSRVKLYNFSGTILCFLTRGLGSCTWILVLYNFLPRIQLHTCKFVCFFILFIDVYLSLITKYITISAFYLILINVSSLIVNMNTCRQPTYLYKMIIFPCFKQLLHSNSNGFIKVI